MTNTATLTENLPSSRNTIRVEKLTCSIGAELSGVDLGEVARDDALFAQIKGLLLEHKVLFFRDQTFSKAEHVELAQRFGELEDHPALGSDPDHPGPRPHLQGSGQPRRSISRMHITATPPGALTRPWDVYCVVWKHLLSAATRFG